MREYIVRIEHGADGAVHYFRTGGEIVRCKDCKRYTQYGMIRGYTLGLCEEYGWQPRSVELDDYCSHGERRSDNA